MDGAVRDLRGELVVEQVQRGRRGARSKSGPVGAVAQVGRQPVAQRRRLGRRGRSSGSSQPSSSPSFQRIAHSAAGDAEALAAGRPRRASRTSRGKSSGPPGVGSAHTSSRRKSRVSSWIRQGREVCALFGQPPSSISIYTVAYGSMRRARATTPRSSWIDEGLRALAARRPRGRAGRGARAALGVTKGGFYWHFDDRRALLDEILDTLGGDERRRGDRAGRGRGRRRARQAAAPVRDRLDQPRGSCGPTSPSATGRGASRAVAERLRRVDNRRMDYMRSLFAGFCADEDEVEARCLLADLAVRRQPLHRRRPRRPQPRRGARARARSACGLSTLMGALRGQARGQRTASAGSAIHAAPRYGHT